MEFRRVLFRSGRREKRHLRSVQSRQHTRLLSHRSEGQSSLGRYCHGRCGQCDRITPRRTERLTELFSPNLSRAPPLRQLKPVLPSKSRWCRLSFSQSHFREPWCHHSSSVSGWVEVETVIHLSVPPRLPAAERSEERR